MQNELLKKIKALGEAVGNDPELKSRLDSDPRAICTEYGIECSKEIFEQLEDLPEDLEIRNNLLGLLLKTKPTKLKLGEKPTKLKFGEKPAGDATSPHPIWPCPG